MNIDELQKKLIAAGRSEVPGDQVPYAFEKRITALLASRVAPDNMQLWVHGLWRAAVSCVAITLLLGAWAVFSIPVASTMTAENLSQNFENTLLASVDQNEQMP
ncbi:MAG: hypothetical protein WDN00_15330 [Limisphaerales bacterium]